MFARVAKLPFGVQRARGTHERHYLQCPYVTQSVALWCMTPKCTCPSSSHECLHSQVGTGKYASDFNLLTNSQNTILQGAAHS